VVIKDGRVVAETYGKGFDANTPLLGWSMTKTFTAGLIGTLVRDGKLRLDQSGLFPQWQGDDRKNITLAHLLAMSSGLHFDEEYGDVTDITRMLYLQPDMAAFAVNQPLAHPPGKVFNYSSGTTAVLSRIWQNALGDPKLALAYPRQALFEPLGMRTAVLEADARGNFVGSSYLFASGRDWARYAQLLLQNGVWNGKVILPPDYVKMMHTPAAAAMAPYGRIEYGQGQTWLRGSPAGTPKGQDPDAGFVLPSDIYWFSGYDGQAIALIPSQQLAVVRLGITPSKLGFKLQPLVQAAVKATGG
jgi:CubicO group peptidase (beta-lactamase class C family)